MADVMPDAIGSAARQVRYDRDHADVHEMVAANFNAARGTVYLARCGDQLRAEAGAMLTTRATDCADCQGDRDAVMVRAGLTGVAVPHA